MIFADIMNDRRPIMNDLVVMSSQVEHLEGIKVDPDGEASASWS